MPRAALALLLTLTVGCASRTSPHDVEPDVFEANRDGFGRVGIALILSPGELDLVVPAKGWWGGLKRGARAGAMAPIIIGFLTPIPGGSFFGALLAPAGAAVGGTYGMAAAPSSELVEEAEAGIAAAVDRLLATDLRDEVQAALVAEARARSSSEVSVAPPLTPGEDGEVDPALVRAPELDTLVLVGPSTLGLAGDNTLDPPLTGVFQVRVRVLRLGGTPGTLYDYDLSCGDAERSFDRWGANEGRAFEGVVRNCTPLLVEKLVDDLFLLDPRPLGEDG